MSKKYFSILVILLILLIPQMSFAEDLTNGEYNYIISDNDTITLTRYLGSEQAVSVPSNLNGKTVTVIGDDCFRGKGLTSLTLPNTIVEIGDCAFYLNNIANNYNESLIIPEGVKIIGDYAFYENNITAVSLPSTLTAIGERAFTKNRIKSITIPRLVETISKWAFQYNKLTTITINEGVKNIESNAFSHNPVSTLTLPSTLEKVGESAFYNGWDDSPKASLGKLILPSSVNTIEKNAFSRCGITELVINSSLESIGEFSFMSNKIKNLNINNIKVIGDGAFSGNELITAEIGGGVETIGYAAFSQNKLQTVTLNEGLKYIKDKAFTGEDPTSDNEDYNFMTEIIIPNSVIEIGNRAFYDNELTNIVIGSSVETIGEYAFAVNSITNLTLGNSVKVIKDSAFSNWYSDETSVHNLTNLEIPNGVEEIGSHSFYGNNIVNLTLPNSIKTIGDYAFKDNSIVELTLPNKLESIGELAFKYNSIESLTVPASVKSIKRAAFQGNQITSLVLNEGLIDIGEHAFYEQHIESLTIPSSVQTIERYAFFNNGIINLTIKDGDQLLTLGHDSFRKNNIENMVFPGRLKTIGTSHFSENPLNVITLKNGVANIEASAFDNLNIESIFIPSSVTNIGAYAFYKSNITNLTFETGSIPLEIAKYAFSYNKLPSLTIPSRASKLGDYCFAYNDLLSGINIVSNIDIVGENVFSSCNISLIDLSNTSNLGKGMFSNNKLSSVSVSNSVLKIPSYFCNSNELETITIPEGAESIGSYAFNYNKLRSVILPSTINKIEECAFYYNPKDNTGIDLEISLPGIPNGEVVWNDNKGNTYQAGDLITDFQAIYTRTITKQNVKSIIIKSSTDSFNITNGVEQLQLSADVFPTEGTNKNVEWSIDNDSVASIDQNGLISVIQNGQVTIKAKATDGSNIYCEQIITISGYTVLADSLTIISPANTGSNTQGVYQLSAAFSPSYTTDKSVTWEIITGSDIASISSNGLLTALKDGIVSVKATANDGTGVFDEINITVRRKSEEEKAARNIVSRNDSQVTITTQTANNESQTVLKAFIFNSVLSRNIEYSLKNNKTLNIDLIPSSKSKSIDVAEIILFQSNLKNIAKSGAVVKGLGGTSIHISKELTNSLTSKSIIKFYQQANNSTYELSKNEELISDFKLETNFKKRVLIKHKISNTYQDRYITVKVLLEDGSYKTINASTIYDNGNLYVQFYTDYYGDFIVVSEQKELNDSNEQNDIDTDKEITETVIEMAIDSKDVLVNNTSYKVDNAPILDENTEKTLVPIKFISQSFGADVEWIAETRSVSISYKGQVITLHIDDVMVKMNDKILILACSPKIINEKTYVPLRFIIETFKAEVQYNSSNKSIKIIKQ